MLVHKMCVHLFLCQKSYGFTITQKFNFFDGNAVALNGLKFEYGLVGVMGIHE